MDFLPIFLSIRERRCLVVGGGEIASRKVALLREADALITVVSPDLTDSLNSLKSSNQLTHIARQFEATDLEGVHLVIAATDDDQVNRLVSELAQARCLPCNVVDSPALCSFVMPSIIDRSPVVIAVSTGGASPILARLLRGKIESIIPTAYGRLAELTRSFRDKVKERFSSVEERRTFWEKVLGGPVTEMVLSGQDEQARTTLEEILSNEVDSDRCKGEVYLVGGGPGDPDLLSFRALRLMQQADVVLHDRLVSEGVLNLTRRDAERIYVGKERSNHSMPQNEINSLLAKLAKQGKRVLRLKGGDPFIFGRGGEEIETLAAEGVPFQVVPGVTAASGCSTYAGIPLTHRDYAQSTVFVTGQLKDGTIDLNWDLLSQPRQTVVIYMGLRGIDIICDKLVEHGVSPDMPVALVQQGTTANQRVITATLSTLHDAIEAEKPKAPTLIIIGEVVTLREKLNWFKTPAEQSSE
ncbi:MAG TPA: uroporphyrinogen-III C-methyltransferase [Chromatiaceae bacterium]|jgi:uroporphyrin-III C-methyltransferase/precorrin-2 dehydrogenase/sirohydrochlorin ferrochelatase|nr:uroporphyrinogen-III C-methyltransferase [Chromatiaceae bacterium]HIN82651.1 uroporphyrinogen-III C-methyltransferase [Chromatiales bacterium]HIO14847.1 uroporphyrinogen-III C-methyltransferase [Chromatiales bacterium]